DPATAYLFAKGLVPVDVAAGALTTGPKGVKQSRPLDFLAVTDHSEWLEITHGCVFDLNSPYYDVPNCKLVRSTLPKDETQVFQTMKLIVHQRCGDNDDDPECVAERRSAWLDLRKDAESANDPCNFTSLVAYEWTGAVQHTWTENGTTITSGVTNHRNVIF